jgi:hypothetical protein
MGILKQIAAKSKAKAVIDSCVNQLQLETAEKYIERYHITFDDFLGKTELMSVLKNKKI